MGTQPTRTLDPQLQKWFQRLPKKQRAEFQEVVARKLRERDQIAELVSYQFRPAEYIERFLGWTPWSGKDTGATGQVELLEDYAMALKKQVERYEYEQGRLPEDQLTVYTPGERVKNWIVIDAGHSVGKTKWLSGIVSHFHDTCRPSIVYCFAPLWPQINDLLFKEIRTDREGSGLPSRVLKGTARVTYSGNHFVTGRATVHGGKTESVHGQHNKYLMFVLDEAEGIPDYVWDAVESMASGGIAIVVTARNPRTTTCMAHVARGWTQTISRRISCLDHPNVVSGKELITGSVRRDYIETQLKNCDVVNTHNAADYTFELPWRPGTIYKPGKKFLWRVLGRASDSESINTFCSRPVFEEAADRVKPLSTGVEELVTYGVDAARYGDDMGTIYRLLRGKVSRIAQLGKDDYYKYYIRIKQDLLTLRHEGIAGAEVRLDAGGGFGGGVADFLNHDFELTNREGTDFEFLASFLVLEVNFNGHPYAPDKFSDKATEMYYHAGEAALVLAVENATEALITDVCERRYRYTKLRGYDVKVLEPKDDFRKRKGRSPDDGDGFVLAVAPTYIIGADVDFWAV